MTRQYTEVEAVDAVARLSVTQLRSFVAADIVTPIQTGGGVVFQQVDLVRLELLCELSEDFDLHEDALGIVISLIDQLHGARSSLRTLLEAIQNEPDEVRERLLAAVQKARSDT